MEMADYLIVLVGLFAIVVAILGPVTVYHLRSGRNKSELGLAWLIICGGGVVAIAGHMAFSYIQKLTKLPEYTPPPRVVDWRQQDASDMAYTMAEQFVKDSLSCPSTAKFPGRLEGRMSHVTSVGNQTYSIVSWVDSSNLFNAPVRARFDCKLRQVDEHRWQLLSIKFD